MRNNQILNYSNPDIFEYDPAAIQVLPGGTQLKLCNAPGQEFPVLFNSGTGKIFDPQKIEFLGGVARQIDQRPVGATFGVTYTTDVNGNWGGGVLTGTPSGAPIITPDGKLDLRPGGKFVRYSATGNADSQQTGCIRFLFTPGYSGAPATNQTLFSIHETFLGVNNLIFLTHTTARRFNLTVYNSVGTAIISAVDLGIWPQQQGTEYEIELNWDINTGATRLFINGTQRGTTQTATGIRSSSINYLTIGAAYNTGNTVNGLFDSLIIFDAVQHTTNYAPGYVVPEYPFLETIITTEELIWPGPGTLISFDLLTLLGSLNIRLSLQIGQSGDFLYWDGLDWVPSDGSYSQATNIVIFNQHLAALSVFGETIGQYNIHFPNGFTSEEIESLTSSLTAQGYPVNSPYIDTLHPFKNVAIEKIDSQLSTPVNTSLSFCLSKNGIWYYYDTVTNTWVISDGTVLQSGPLLNIHRFNTGACVLTKKRIFLNSTGSATPNIQKLTIHFYSILFFNTYQVKLNNPYDVHLTRDPQITDKAPEYRNGTTWLNSDTGASWFLTDEILGTWTQTDQDKDIRIWTTESFFTINIFKYLSNFFIAPRVLPVILPENKITLSREKAYNLLAYESITWQCVFSAEEKTITFTDFTGDISEIFYPCDLILVQDTRRNNGYLTIVSVENDKIIVNEPVQDESCTPFIYIIEKIPEFLPAQIARLLWFDLYQRPYISTGYKSERIGTYSYTKENTVAGLGYPESLITDLSSYENIDIGGTPFYVD